MKNELMTNLTRGVNNIGFKIKKHSPELLLGAGIVGVVASTVMACKATTKVEGILAESKQKVETVHKVLEDPTISEEKYSAEDGKKDLAIIYAQTGLKLAKLYAPAVGLGVLSIASILTSHNIMNKRNMALSAAYAAVDAGFKDYRKNVVDRFGEAMDRELKYNIHTKEIEETVINEDGTETKEKKTVEVVNLKPGHGSEFAKFFDEYNPNWSKDAERNKKFLLDQQRWLTDKLRKRGRLFLNEVYEELGFPITRVGQVVGWVYDPKRDAQYNSIDFGIFDLYKEENRLFVNGYERSILLDFEPHGNVFQLMGYDDTKTSNIREYLD